MNKKFAEEWKELKAKQEKRKAYMREYMKTNRAKGIHKPHKPRYVKNWSNKTIEMSYDARTLFDMLNKANVERLKLVEKYEKAIDRLTKIIEKNQREIRSKDDLLVKYQLSQEYLAKLIQEQTIDIDDYQDKIRALGIQITSYEKKFN
jgi:hypothetical protein